MRLVAIDPSLRATGWAVFDNGALTSCGIVKTSAGMRPAEVAHEVAQRLSQVIGSADAAVIEMPQAYRASRSRGDPKDVLAVATVAGACAALSPHAEYVSPHDWKGTVPKTNRLCLYIVHRRNVRALDPASLARYERSLAAWAESLRHNIADAVGLGVFWMKRQAAMAPLKGTSCER